MLITAFLVGMAAGKANPQGYFILSQVSGTDMRHPGMEKHWTAPQEASERRNPVPADRDSLLRGSDLYQKHCVACHGDLGRGDGPAGATLAHKPSDLWTMGMMHSAGDLAWKIANGRGPMPAWKEILTESQIWDLVNFIQNLGTAQKGP